jgi:hypothetical protein
MATTAVAPGAALGAATRGRRHQQLSTRSEAPQPRAPVAAGRASPEQLDDRTAAPARLAAPDERTGAG